MNVLFFASNFERTDVKEILSTVHRSHPGITIKRFTECQTLFDWLRIPPRSFFVAILLPDRHQTLAELVFMKDLFMDRKVILSLPDDDPRSIAISHKLTPLFFLNASDCRSELLSVLEKLLSGERESVQRVEEKTKLAHRQNFSS